MAAHGSGRLAWLGLTPEPERELPAAVAVLRSRQAGGNPDIASERRRITRLLLHGTQRTWLRYLAEITQMIEAAMASPEPASRSAARHAAAIVLEHHRMLIGLPGGAYAATASRRIQLDAALRRLAADDHTQPGGES